MRRVSHDEFVEMLRSGDESAAVIELTAETSGDDEPRRAGATLVSPHADRPAAHRKSARVVVVDAAHAPSSERAAIHSALPPVDPDEEMAASVREITSLREALSQREQQLLSLHDELLQRERELSLLRARARRSAVPSRHHSFPPPSEAVVSTEIDEPSSLGTACARFLSDALERTIDDGWRSAREFTDRFPPTLVMGDLDRHPAVRAAFLRLLVGVPERTALRTATNDAGRLLQNAVDEGDCKPESYARVFHRTAAVGYMDPERVWSFVTGDDLVALNERRDKTRLGIARGHVGRLLDAAILHKLLTPLEIVEGITVEVLAERLPRRALASMLRSAVDAGRRSAPFVDADVLLAVSSAVIVEHVPLARIVESVLAPMARTAVFLESRPA